MPRTLPTTSYATRTPPSSTYDRPRFISSLVLCDSSLELLFNSSGELLESTGDPTITAKISTNYT